MSDTFHTSTSTLRSKIDYFGLVTAIGSTKIKCVASADFTWKPRRGDRRDPRQYVKGQFSQSPTGAFALIRNALDYISEALRPGALTEAIDAATKRLEYNIDNHLGKALA